MFHYDYATPRRVCSRAIHIDLDDTGATIEHVSFDGGCPGNLQAVSKLVAGHPVAEVVSILAGNDCGGRGTSCADQLSIALAQASELAHERSRGAAPQMGPTAVAAQTGR